MTTLAEIRSKVQRVKPLVDLLDLLTATATGGTGINHAGLAGVTANQHHAQAHTLSGADHTGTLSDTQHGSRTVTSAHGEAHISDDYLDDLQRRLQDGLLDRSAYSESSWDGSGRYTGTTYWEDSTKAKKLVAITIAYS